MRTPTSGSLDRALNLYETRLDFAVKFALSSLSLKASLRKWIYVHISPLSERGLEAERRKCKIQSIVVRICAYGFLARTRGAPAGGLSAPRLRRPAGGKPLSNPRRRRR